MKKYLKNSKTHKMIVIPEDKYDIIEEGHKKSGIKTINQYIVVAAYKYSKQDKNG